MLFNQNYFFMSVRVVIGSQWGDEGKGKIIDLLSPKASWVVRYQGGANAGHTLKFDDTTMVLHLIPSGIFHPNSKCIIGNGVVIDPIALLDELNEVKSHGVDPTNRLFISQSAHVILAYHKLIDKAKELNRGDDKIGTTGRGIGPAYRDKVSRNGIRLLDLLKPESLKEKIDRNCAEVNDLLELLNSPEIANSEAIFTEIMKAADILKPFITDTGLILYNAHKANENILLEGAQGALLDVDHGTYPYVTSSSPTSGGACTGSGLPPTAITHVMGITKAYCTRVGNGPFPTELVDAVGDKIRDIGNEYGATTGRPRRCGWLDLVALKYAVRINGLNELTITKLDVLDHLDEINICTEYEIDGHRTDNFPIDCDLLDKVIPVYTTLNGWNKNTRYINESDVSGALADYIAFIENYLNVKVVILSTGPKRSETLILSDINT